MRTDKGILTVIGLALRTLLLAIEESHEPDESCGIRPATYLMTCPWCEMKQDITNAIDNLERVVYDGEDADRDE